MGHIGSSFVDHKTSDAQVPNTDQNLPAERPTTVAPHVSPKHSDPGTNMDTSTVSVEHLIPDLNFHEEIDLNE